MDKGNKSKEGEMGSGDSDDEFYNVKLPYTPTVASTKSAEKKQVKKVYSPPRTKVTYDYKFDSSSGDESENEDKKKEVMSEGSLQKNIDEGLSGKEIEPVKNSNVPKDTFKVVEKINEELKNVKSGTKTSTESKEHTQNNAVNSISSAANVTRPQIGVVPPVVVVPPPMVVPQASVMSMSPMIVPPVGMGGQGLMPGPMNMMAMPGNLLRVPASIGSLMANQNVNIANSMLGMNTVPSMMGIQSSIMGIPANSINTPGNVLGFQGGMISPAMSNMTVQGNMVRMANNGSNLLQMQGPASNLMGIQSTNNLMSVPRSGSNVLGLTMNVSGTTNSMVGIQSHIPGIIGTPNTIMVNSANLLSNQVVGNTENLVVVGSMINNAATNCISSQTKVLPGSGSSSGSNNMTKIMSSTQGNSPVRPLPPPPFLNIRNRPLGPGSYKWQAPNHLTDDVSKFGSSNTPASSSSPSSSASSSSSHSSNRLEREEVKDYKENSSSDNSLLEKSESQSPSRELPNTFKNDGSFMEIFKKLKEEKEETSSKFSNVVNDPIFLTQLFIKLLINLMLFI